MTLPPDDVCHRMRVLHALVGSTNGNEAESARRKLTELLAKHGLTWNDLPAILAAEHNRDARANTTATQASPDAPAVNVLDLVLALIEEYVAITAEQLISVALWILHTYVFDLFVHTPRLALLSPVRGCGKSNLLIVLEALCARPYRSDNVTAAAIYYELHRSPGTTLLLDEGDNLGLLNDPVMRAVFNSGHRRGGAISRFVRGLSRKFSTFGPLAVAAIGTLPLPLMHRAIVISMQRQPPDTPAHPQPDENDPAFAAARAEIQKWAAPISL